jgi:hypothetical protein
VQIRPKEVKIFTLYGGPIIYFKVPWWEIKMLERIRLWKLAVAGMVLASVLVVGGCSGAGYQTALGAAFLAWQLGVFDKKSSNDNMAPQILTLTAVPNSVALGGTVALTVVAVDSDSDTLTYQWTAPAGTFTTASSQMTNWVAPTNNTGTYYINITVTDGKNPVTSRIPVTVTL